MTWDLIPTNAERLILILEEINQIKTDQAISLDFLAAIRKELRNLTNRIEGIENVLGLTKEKLPCPPGQMTVR